MITVIHKYVAVLAVVSIVIDSIITLRICMCEYYQRQFYSANISNFF